jgi:cardiolipin synthase
LDGYLAKRFNWVSNLGKVLDPAADKLLLVSVYLVATWYGLMPPWLTIAAVARDVLIPLGALAIASAVGRSTGARRSAARSIPCCR